MLKKLWNNMEEYLLVYSLMLSVGLVFIQVVMRYVFSNSLSWSEELARYLFLWQIWVGASYAVKEHRHLRIELIQILFMILQKKMFELFALSLWLGFSVFLAFEGSTLTAAFREGSFTGNAYPYGLCICISTVGCTLMSIRLIPRCLRF
jgi:TRAP-type C4-dicarboxylate transport system permease small subunit